MTSEDLSYLDLCASLEAGTDEPTDRGVFVWKSGRGKRRDM